MDTHRLPLLAELKKYLIPDLAHLAEQYYEPFDLIFDTEFKEYREFHKCDCSLSRLELYIIRPMLLINCRDEKGDLVISEAHDFRPQTELRFFVPSALRGRTFEDMRRPRDHQAFEYDESLRRTLRRNQRVYLSNHDGH